MYVHIRGTYVQALRTSKLSSSPSVTMNGLSEKPSEPLASSQSSRDSEFEENTLRKKVQIKTQALMMLSQELDQCRMQRDRYKLMAEQLQEDLVRRKQLDKNGSDKGAINGYRSMAKGDGSNGSSIRPIVGQQSRATSLEEDTNLMDLLIETREQNKCLRLQVDTLRVKLKEAQEDIKALRAKKSDDSKPSDVTLLALHQREEMIEQLEKLNVKCRQLKLDLQVVLDEKQELEMERDAFKCKAHRLNHELSQALGASRSVDVDALVNENRYLQERLQQLLEEKELTQQSVQKYKSMLDSKRQKGTIKLGGKSSVGSVMNFKQVEQLLQQGPNIPPQKAADALSELHSICTALLEALNDKNLALAHQKKANKILAARMCELEKTIQSPTMKLLDGYSSVNVDIKCDATSVTSDLSEEISESKESDLQSDVNCITDRDTKSKQSEESSGEKSVNSRESEERCGGNRAEIENDIDNCTTDENESYYRSAKYSNVNLYKGKPTFERVNFDELIKIRLPEHLRLMVQKHIDELEEKERRDSRETK